MGAENDERRLRYSERRKLAEEGSLGVLTHDRVPGPLLNAIETLVQRRSAIVASNFDRDLRDACALHFGWAPDVSVRTAFSTEVDVFLDFCEILVEEGERRRTKHGYRALSGVEDSINGLFGRHGFGYRIENGQARPIASPALDREVVGPALIEAAKPGWEHVEGSYQEALRHLRSGDADDALTAANAAVESAFKAMGLAGKTLGELATSLRNSGLVQGATDAAVKDLVSLFGKLMAWRSTDGSAHGKHPDAPAPPLELATLAVHWAGAIIVYLAEVNASLP